MEVDGVPEEVDTAIRRLESIQAQLAALADDDDKLSVQTRERLEAEAAELEPKVASMRERIESRRGVVGAVRAIRTYVKENRLNI